MYRAIIGDGPHCQSFNVNLQAARISAAKVMAKTGEKSAQICRQEWVTVETLEAEEAERLLVEHRKKFGDERIPA